MREIFVDTSAWAAITDSKDRNHAAAVKFMQQIARKSHLVITDYILDEAYTLLLRKSVWPVPGTWWRNMAKCAQRAFGYSSTKSYSLFRS